MKEKQLNKKNKIFGTDGVRSKYGTYPLDKKSILKLGKAIGLVFREKKVLIGRDTRESGTEIEKLLNFSLSDYAEIKSCGVVPTPVLSFLVDKGGFDFGIMITASHNPFYDNGIKLFKQDGEKIAEDLEALIEDNFFSLDELAEYSDLAKPALYEYSNQYINYIKDVCKKEELILTPIDNRSIKLIIDCANGAFYNQAPAVFSDLGFKDISFINIDPDGKNINEKCGALYVNQLANKVMEMDADLGIAFDGDGDRLICVDSNGFVLNGDYIILLIAKFLTKKKNGSTSIIGTTMANLGFEKALNKVGLNLTRTDVGDKFVYREMKKTGAVLGGEQSGHIILKGFKTGDGLLSALYFISAINYFNININDIYKEIEIYPQILKSIPVDKKVPIKDWDLLKNEINKFEENHGKNSRIVIRYSGTEPKIRVMIESESEDIVKKNIKVFEDIIRRNRT